MCATGAVTWARGPVATTITHESFLPAARAYTPARCSLPHIGGPRTRKSQAAAADASAPISTPNVTRPLARRSDGEVLWFMALAPPMGRADKQAWHFQESAKVALLSAQANAPSLMPHLIYLQGPADSFTTWMHSHGARVHVRTLRFFDELTAAQLERDKGLLNWGAYGDSTSAMAVPPSPHTCLTPLHTHTPIRALAYRTYSFTPTARKISPLTHKSHPTGA